MGKHADSSTNLRSTLLQRGEDLKRKKKERSNVLLRSFHEHEDEGVRTRERGKEQVGFSSLFNFSLVQFFPASFKLILLIVSIIVYGLVTRYGP